MNILFLCGREVRYPLNSTLLQSFRQFSNVDVIDEHGSGKSILRRSIKVFLSALPKIRSKKYDLIFIGFFGHLLVPPIRLVTRTPILFHPFISTFETLAYDRKKAKPNSILGKAAYQLDYSAHQAADHILLDTEANVRYFSKLCAVPIERFSVVFVGSDEKIFYPRPARCASDTHIVLYHGSFLPLQGIDTVIEAARLLRGDTNIRFRLLGNGMEYERIHQMVQAHGLTNVEFAPPVPLEQLPDAIAEASICLGGHFGTSKKATRVIAGKSFQDIAMGKATIVGENEANHELLTHRHDAWFCPMDDPEALANAVLTLVSDSTLREEIGRNARVTFLQKASLDTLNPQVKMVAERAMSVRR